MTIPSTEDTQRRKQLNEQTNPRKTIYGEATQTLNPLTGKPYIENFVAGLDDADSDADYVSNVLKEVFPNRPAPKRRTSDFIECQKTLARMDVRENKMPSQDYIQALLDLKVLAKEFAKSPMLTIDSIKDAAGLDQALRLIDRTRITPHNIEEYMERLAKERKYPKEIYQIKRQGNYVDLLEINNFKAT